MGSKQKEIQSKLLIYKLKVMKQIITILMAIISCGCYAQSNSELEIMDSTSIEHVQKVKAARRAALLTPKYLANWIGTSFFTKDNIENDCGVEPSAYSGGKVFYAFDNCYVGIEYNSLNVGVSLSFRLFGEDGYKFKNQLIKYGYVVVRRKPMTIFESDYTGRGTLTIMKKKLKVGGYSVCELLEGQFMMFEFYRSQK